MSAIGKILLTVVIALSSGLAAVFFWVITPRPDNNPETISYQPRKQDADDSGYTAIFHHLEQWKDPTDLEEIRRAYIKVGYRNIAKIDEDMKNLSTAQAKIPALISKASLFNYEGEPKKTYEVLQNARQEAMADRETAAEWLYTIIFLQGVAGMRRGETENCLECRGEGACIFPLRRAALHTKPAGSRLAIRHFTEYLEQFPDDQGARWLLNLAYMTLGEHPSKVPPEFLMTFDHFGAEADMGRFRDIGHLAGVNRLNQAGGAVMDDFHNNGLLDLVVTTWDPTAPMKLYRNKGDGTFEDRTEAAGLSKQYGGFNIVQTDYNNDGFLDLYISRGAWLQYPMRPTLLRNNGDGTFADVTREAGLMDPINSHSAIWADYDNDGFLDLFICNERGPNRLYRNRGDGTFEEVAARAGVQGKRKFAKGAVWLDYDNDGYPDLFVNYFESTPQLFHNNRDGTFSDVTAEMGIDGPYCGFSCWAFDYDNDGWLDLFATCYHKSLENVVRDFQGMPLVERMDVTRLYRNIGGQKFQDVSSETGVDKIFATMGSSFADFDNDGYLDFYLGTGDPSLNMIVPNRMFKNLGGKRFADITATSGTGHLQKGHSVCCGDWDRDGNVDMFVQIGGALPGDSYRNALFQNPGHDNSWLTVKLVGKKTNRAAIGARIKMVTAGEKPLSVYRHVSTGSSFGGNPLQQTIGLGKASRVATLEIRWPTSQTTQVFRDVPVGQAIEVTEFAKEYRKLNWTRLQIPKE